MSVFLRALTRLSQRLGAKIQARQSLVVEDIPAGIEAVHIA